MSEQALGACGVLITVPLLGVSLVAAAAVTQLPCAPVWWSLAGWTLLLVAGGSFILLAHSVIAIMRPNFQGQANGISA